MSCGKTERHYHFAQTTAIAFSLKIYLIYTYTHAHTTEKGWTRSFLMTAGLGGGIRRHSKEFLPLVDCDLDFQGLQCNIY